MIEKSLKYNVWKELITLFVIYMILSLTWFFGAGLYDPFQSITGYKLTGKKNVIAVVQEDGQSLRLKDPNKGEHVQYTLAEQMCIRDSTSINRHVNSFLYLGFER